MPCYNAAATLPEALASLAQQTLPDYELVAVDDGSQDETRAVLAAHARQDTRLKLISIPHGGIVQALNHGLAACQAPLVARMDADDRAHPHRLALQRAYLHENPRIDVAGCLVSAFPEHQVRGGFRVYLDWLNRLVENADIRREIFIESPLPHPSVMFRAAAVRAAGGYQDHGWAEDYDLWLRLYLRGGCFGKVPRQLLAWREHPRRLTRIDGRYSLENFIRAKAHYLLPGPLQGRNTLIIWGAGMVGRRLSKYLLRQGAPLSAFVDIDPQKIGRTRRGAPIVAPEDLPDLWQAADRPVLLAAVGARGARQLIRARLNDLGLVEAEDWWSVA
jgi:glycosyltransferase involved in cell wall biosynthesis